jgi:methionyl-tRNA formyltransferase
VVFAGTSAFAVPSLRALVDAGHDLPLVVTQPDRVGGRGLKPTPSAIKTAAAGLHLQLFQPERIREPQAQERIRNLDADVMVVVAYGQILPASLIRAPRLQTVNVHASLLPRHRGPAPIEWAILSGDQQTGVTIMQMDAGVDTGPILSTEVTSIGSRETASQLEARLADMGARLLVRTLSGLDTGRVLAVPQPSEGASHARRLTSEDGKLDPGLMTALEIDRRVRALGERVGTWIRVRDVQVKVLAGHLDGDPNAGIPVQTREGMYVVDEVQPPGGRRMSAAAWLRGKR